ncbi:MAG: 3-deoxy-manno-octulosonate cytidylyltransferase [Gammaproteobacteria bacterium]
MSFTVVIPARFASTRLPGKLLLDLAGKPVIQHVYERALESGAEQVIVATDDRKIVDAVKQFSGNVTLTNENHQSGTDRITEAVSQYKLLDETIVVNVQGDEPLISPAEIQQVAADLEHHSDASMTTLRASIDNAADIFNPDIVKVVVDEGDYALYFSRAPIPWHREHFRNVQPLTDGTADIAQLQVPYFRHLGIYAYRAGFLKHYVTLSQSPLEKTEALEQLRALENGYKIYVGQTQYKDSIGIDTRDDYEKVRQILERC